MDYIDWVESVASGFITLWAARGNSRDGVRLAGMAEHLGLERTELVDECLRGALSDLRQMGLVDDGLSTFGPDGGCWTATQTGEELRDLSLRTVWAQLFTIYLTDDQLDFLRAVCEQSEERFDDMARVNYIQASEVAAALDLDWSDPDTLIRGYETVKRLSEQGLTVDRATGGGHLPFQPTYGGIVRATQAELTEDHELICELLDEGETTNVDFKREMDLSPAKGKAEFVRDVLALANSQLSGRRHILIGIDDDGAEYTDADQRITLERIEQTLQAWAPPAPPLRLRRVTLNRVEIALVEVARNRVHLPYVAVKSHGTLKAGVVYVRHGTHTEPATEAEEADIRAEGERARAEGSEVQQ